MVRRVKTMASGAASIACLTACMATPAETVKLEDGPVILADSNRDGVVTPADQPGRETWTDSRGAILLPNIGDTARRCPDFRDNSYTADDLETCHDAEGTGPRAPDYFAPVRTLPYPGLSDTATAHVRAVGAGAGNIRIFIRRDDGWTWLGPDDTLTAAEVADGAELGVDSRDIVRDGAVWDGRVTLRFSISDGTAEMNDEVAMKVAPVVVHSHLQHATEVFIPNSRNDHHRDFVDALSGALDEIGFDTPMRRIDTLDTWAQDFVEFGHVSMPGPDATVKSIRIAIRSPQPTRTAGRALFGLRGPGFGVIQTGGDAYHQVDSFGNLETVPPYTFNGRAYPAGRVIYGDAGDGYAPHSDFSRFFAAQAVQAPIVLDTSWLIIAHVDEFVQFLPADTPRGWTIAVKDVDSAMALLRKAQADGHGGTRAFSHEDAPDITIDELLADEALREANEIGRRKVELNLQILLAATGLSEDEVVRIPGLFEHSAWVGELPTASVRNDTTPPPTPSDEAAATADGKDGPITYSPGTLIALYPAAVNGLLLDETNYIPPKQWGPVIDGTDIMEAAINAAYATAGIRAWSIDDWKSHHEWGGEVHCGTNVTREISSAWWQ